MYRLRSAGITALALPSPESVEWHRPSRLSASQASPIPWQSARYCANPGLPSTGIPVALYEPHTALVLWVRGEADLNPGRSSVQCPLLQVAGVPTPNPLPPRLDNPRHERAWSDRLCK